MMKMRFDRRLATRLTAVLASLFFALPAVATARLDPSRPTLTDQRCHQYCGTRSPLKHGERVRSPTAASTVVETAHGFRWRDAGLGAALGAAIVLIVLAAAIATTATRHRIRVHRSL
jgi:hypothetical protein